MSSKDLNVYIIRYYIVNVVHNSKILTNNEKNINN
jgi:hypothetical protein